MDVMFGALACRMQRLQQFACDECKVCMPGVVFLSDSEGGRITRRLLDLVPPGDINSLFAVGQQRLFERPHAWHCSMPAHLSYRIGSVTFNR